MTFQFLCPQGHLLQGEEAHMGMQCQCPQCGVAFIIPTVAAQSGDAAPPVPELAPLEDEIDSSDLSGLEVSGSGLSALAASGLDAGDFSNVSIEIGDVVDEVGETLLHIPCPNGHVLDVPMDMIGAKAMCPHCRAEFRLRREKSIEFLREQEIIDAKRAKFWFKLAVVAASVVVVVLMVMVLAIAIG